MSKKSFLKIHLFFIVFLDFLRLVEYGLSEGTMQ